MTAKKRNNTRVKQVRKSVIKDGNGKEIERIKAKTDNIDETRSKAKLKLRGSKMKGKATKCNNDADKINALKLQFEYLKKELKSKREEKSPRIGLNNEPIPEVINDKMKKLRVKKESNIRSKIPAGCETYRKRSISKVRGSNSDSLGLILPTSSLPQSVYIHIGDGGEGDLMSHLAGNKKISIQVLQIENLPDIDCTELVNGQDREGTSRDFIDQGHSCTVLCPVGCQGHLRPNELVIIHSSKVAGRLVNRKRIKARLIHREKGDLEAVSGSNPPILASLHMDTFRRIGGKRRPRPEWLSREVIMKQLRKSLSSDRNYSAISPVPSILGTRMPQRVSDLLLRPPVSRAVAEAHGWNPRDMSRNVSLKSGDVLTMRRRPVSQSTDGVRAKVGYSEGLHVFQVTWPVRQRGTHPMVGVATLQAQVQEDGYCCLVGSNNNSWGWDLGRKKALHTGGDTSLVQGKLFPPSLTHHHQWTVPDSFYMVLDMDRGSLAWVVGHQYLGESHTGLAGLTLYPIVSSVWGHCEVSMRYLGSNSSHHTLSLKELSRVEVRRMLGGNTGAAINLGLPVELAHYLVNGE